MPIHTAKVAFWGAYRQPNTLQQAIAIICIKINNFFLKKVLLTSKSTVNINSNEYSNNLILFFLSREAEELVL
jgi:hypothetical protein